MGHRLRIDPHTFLAAAAAVLILPLDWFLSAIIAAAYHEFCHYLAIRLLGQKVQGLTIRPSGAEMSVSKMRRGVEGLCAAAGPIGSLSLLLMAKWFPKLAICGLVQGIFNLLPVYPLDGGRILRCLASDKVCRSVQRVIGAMAVFIGIYMVKYSIVPLLLVAVGCIRLLERKIPCKEG